MLLRTIISRSELQSFWKLFTNDHTYMVYCFWLVITDDWSIKFLGARAPYHVQLKFIIFIVSINYNFVNDYKLLIFLDILNYYTQSTHIMHNYIIIIACYTNKDLIMYNIHKVITRGHVHMHAYCTIFNMYSMYTFMYNFSYIEFPLIRATDPGYWYFTYDSSPIPNVCDDIYIYYNSRSWFPSRCSNQLLYLQIYFY